MLADCIGNQVDRVRLCRPVVQIPRQLRPLRLVRLIDLRQIRPRPEIGVIRKCALRQNPPGRRKPQRDGNPVLILSQGWRACPAHPIASRPQELQRLPCAYSREQVDGRRRAHHAQEVRQNIVPGKHCRQQQHNQPEQQQPVSGPFPTPQRHSRAQPEKDRLPSPQHRLAGKVVPPVRVPANAENQQILPHVAQKGAKRVSLLFAQQPDLSAAHQKVLRMKRKVEQNRRGNQPGNTNKRRRPRQFAPYSCPGKRAQRKEKAQTKEQKQERGETRRNIRVRQQPRANSRQRNPPPAPRPPPLPQQRKGQDK